MLKIRLKKLGKKNRPFYKVSVMESLCKRDGKSIENLGYYDPIKKQFCIKKARVILHLQNGAQPSNTVRHLLLKHCLGI